MVDMDPITTSGIIGYVLNVTIAIVSSVIVGTLLNKKVQEIDNERKKIFDSRNYKSILNNGEIILEEYREILKLSRKIGHDQTIVENIDQYLEAKYARLKSCNDRIQDLKINMYNISDKEDHKINCVLKYSSWLLDTYFKIHLNNKARYPYFLKYEKEFPDKVSQLSKIIEET